MDKVLGFLGMAIKGRFKVWMAIGLLVVIAGGGITACNMWANHKESLRQEGAVEQSNASLQETLENVETAHEVENAAADPTTGILLAECLRSATEATARNCLELLPDSEAVPSKNPQRVR